MSKRLLPPLIIALVLTGCDPVRSLPEPVQQAPPPPPPRAPDFRAAELHRLVEEKVLEVLSPEALRQAQAAQTSVMAVSYQGRFDQGRPRVNVAVRSETNWVIWKSGRAAELAASVGAELDRLLGDPAFWREAPYYPGMDCPDAGATVMVIRHKGEMRVTRQGCSPAGLTGRLEVTILNERLPLDWEVGA